MSFSYDPSPCTSEMVTSVCVWVGTRIEQDSATMIHVSSAHVQPDGLTSVNTWTSTWAIVIIEVEQFICRALYQLAELPR